MSDGYDVDFDTLGAEYGIEEPSYEPAQAQPSSMYAPSAPQASQSRFAFNVESEATGDHEAQQPFSMRMPVDSPAPPAASPPSYATAPTISQRTPFFASQQQQPSHSRPPFFAQPGYQSSHPSPPSFMNSSNQAGSSRGAAKPAPASQQRFQEVLEPGAETDADDASTDAGQTS